LAWLRNCKKKKKTVGIATPQLELQPLPPECAWDTSKLCYFA